MTTIDRPAETKRCPRCGEIKDWSDFPSNRRRTPPIGTYCKPCHVARTLAQRAKDPERHRAKGRAYMAKRFAEEPETMRDQRLRSRFGIGLAAYEELLDRQGGVCTICRQPDSTGRRLAVDHDARCCSTNGRSCGRCVRGLICYACNTALGQLGHDPDRLRRAANYLEGRA